MIINHNLNAMNAHRQMGINVGNQGKAMEKLSSGLRINRAGDDAAGLAISEKMRGQIRGLEQGSRNAQDGISLIQTAEGATNETHTILQRMRELAVQSSNGTNEDEDRTQIQKEFSQLQKEITRIGEQTEFNKKKVLDGTLTEVTFQVGANEGQTIKVDLKSMKADDIGLKDTVKVDTQTAASKAISSVETAIKNVSEFRADLGSVQNRLESSIRSTDNSAENLQAAESRVRDIDMAKEMMNLSKNNILAQAAQSMLGQANQQPQGVLQLLR